MLNFSLGSPAILNGSPAILTDQGARGHAVFGPYTHQEPGRYAVDFMIAVAPESAPADGICAVIDVITDSGQTDIAYDYVTASELAEGRPIRLEFDLPQASVLEYRVWIDGNTRLLIADTTEVSVRTGDLAARTRLSSMTVPGFVPRFTKHLFEHGVPVNMADDTLSVEIKDLSKLAHVAMLSRLDQTALNDWVIEAIGWHGDDENRLYRAFAGQERAITSPPQPVRFSSTLCQQAHFLLDQYRYWASALKETPRFQRKQWEFVYIAQALFERGYLAPGKRGLVFGAGEEQLPALFASWGVKVLASDQAPESAAQGGWAESSQHTYDIAALNKRGICTDRMFTDLVSYRSVDMNDIPAELDGQFDFCWSACALEHLGSLEHGLRFIEASLRTLRPGGLAVHTTEYNLSSNDETTESVNLSIYRRRDIEALIDRLQASGFEVAPMDWSLGEGFAETVIDLPPFGRGEPHIRLMSGQYETTSIGLIIRKNSA